MALGSLLFRIVRIPKLRVRLWKLAYELFPKLLPDANWWFMNYGYEPTDAERATYGTLDESLFQWRSRAMYHYLAARAHIEGKEVLEVGCGRGGGSGLFCVEIRETGARAHGIGRHARQWSLRLCGLCPYARCCLNGAASLAAAC